MALDYKHVVQVRADAHQAVLDKDYLTAVALYLSIDDGASATAVATLQLSKVMKGKI